MNFFSFDWCGELAPEDCPSISDTPYIQHTDFRWVDRGTRTELQLEECARETATDCVLGIMKLI